MKSFLLITLVFFLATPSFASKRCSAVAVKAAIKKHSQKYDRVMLGATKFLGVANVGRFKYKGISEPIRVYSISTTDEGGAFLWMVALTAKRCKVRKVTLLAKNDD